MTHPASASLSPKIFSSELSSDQDNRPSTSAGAGSSTQRQQGQIPLPHADTRPTASRFQAKFDRPAQDDARPGNATRQGGPVNLHDLPAELLVEVIKYLPKRGPNLTSIAWVNKASFSKIAGLVSDLVEESSEAESALFIELVSKATDLTHVLGHRAEGDFRLFPSLFESVRTNLKRAEEGLIQQDYLKVLHTHVSHIDELGIRIRWSSFNGVDKFDQASRAIRFFVESLAKIEPKKTAKEERFPEQAIRTKLAIGEMLLRHIDHLLTLVMGYAPISLAKQRELAGCIRTLIKDMRRLVKYQETPSTEGGGTERKTGRAVLKTRMPALTDVLRKLLKHLSAWPTPEAQEAYSRLTQFLSTGAVYDEFTRRGLRWDSDISILFSAKEYIRVTNLRSLDLEKLQEDLVKLDDAALRREALNLVTGLKQQMDKRIYVDVLGAICYFVHDVFPDDESKMDYIMSATRHPASAGGKAREPSENEHFVIRQMLKLMEDPQLKKEAEILLKGGTAMQRLSGSFSSLFR